jgi:hypothetical protein
MRSQALMADIDEILLAEIAERRADGEDGDGASARGDICSLLVPPASRTAVGWTTARFATS